jgi:hypothetical protein
MDSKASPETEVWNFISAALFCEGKVLTQINFYSISVLLFLKYVELFHSYINWKIFILFYKSACFHNIRYIPTNKSFKLKTCIAIVFKLTFCLSNQVNS